MNHIFDLIKKYERDVTVLTYDIHDKYIISNLKLISNATIVNFCQNISCENNCITLKREPSLYDMQILSAVEHFDVAYINFDLFHSEDCKEQWISTFENIAENVFLKSTGKLQKPFVFLGNDLNYSYKRREYILGNNWIHYLEVMQIYNCGPGDLHHNERYIRNSLVRRIESSFSKKTLTKNYPGASRIVTSEWLPGINLLTYKMLCGISPCTEIRCVFEIHHLDWSLNNIIVSKFGLQLIDLDDPYVNGYRTIKTKKMLDLSLEFVEETDYNKLIDIFKRFVLEQQESYIRSNKASNSE